MEIMQRLGRTEDAAGAVQKKAEAVILMKGVDVKLMNNRELVRWYKRVVENPDKHSMYQRMDVIDEKEKRLQAGRITTDEIAEFNNENK